MDINHIGITVPDIELAVEFYCDVFGMKVLSPPRTHTDATAFASRRKDVFGEQWKGMKLAHLATPSGCGFELFEFLEPSTCRPADAFAYWNIGVSHVCITVDDFDATLDRLTESGGTRCSGVHTVRQGVKICYCQDPWGVVIEVASAPYASIVGVTGNSEE